MELKPQFVFRQFVNDATGYSLVLAEDAEIQEIEQKEEIVENSDISEVYVSTYGQVISLTEAERLWGDNFEQHICLVENPPPNDNSEDAGLRSFEPLDHFESLFRTFSATDPTPSGILSFASRFGLLTGPDDTRTIPGESYVAELYGTEPVHLERLADWFEQILQMRDVISLWDMTKSQDLKGLSRYLRWSDGKLAYWTDYQGLSPKFRLIYDAGSPAGQALGFREGDLFEPAMFLASTIANINLESRVSPQLEYSGGYLTPRLAISPLNLLGALWLQFARAIDGNREYRACQHCSTWFEIGSKGHSRARRFCSNRCRMAFSRARKKSQENDQ